MFEIREFDTRRDLDGILDLCRDSVRELGIEIYFPPLESKEFEDTASSVFTQVVTVCLVCEDEGRLTGAVGFVITPTLWDRSKKIGEELFWFSRPGSNPRSAIPLLKAGVKMCKDQGADILNMTKMENSPKGVERVYKMLGLKRTQECFSGEL